MKPTPQLERLAADMVVLCADPGDLPHALDLLAASYATPAAEAARARLKADPAIATLIRERYWGNWPELAALAALPAGSLGHAYGHLLLDQGLEPLPPPVLPPGADGDTTYLQLRIRHCHDVWHAIAGCPTSLAGEAAMNGLTTEQLRWPGCALLLAADLIHRVHDDLDPHDPAGVDVGRAIAYGLELGASTSAPLLAQRWEQGWERPLADWRRQLGLTALIARNPFAAAVGGGPG
ncbi:MAG: Coq4 family protein [Cyanobacteria bacterium]|nr:Coq4 family protein [Cyanobacteriota bacterium]